MVAEIQPCGGVKKFPRSSHVNMTLTGTILYKKDFHLMWNIDTMTLNLAGNTAKLFYRIIKHSISSLLMAGIELTVQRIHLKPSEKMALSFGTIATEKGIGKDIPI